LPLHKPESATIAVPRASARGSPTGVLSGGHRHEPRAWGGPPTPGNRRSIIAAEIGQYAARLQRDDRAVAFDAAYAARGGPAEARRPRRSRTRSRAILSITQCARTPPEIDQTEDALTARRDRECQGACGVVNDHLYLRVYNEDASFARPALMSGRQVAQLVCTAEGCPFLSRAAGAAS
jgi:hypothetical protein